MGALGQHNPDQFAGAKWDLNPGTRLDARFAKVVKALDGLPIKIPGFVVPLEFDNELHFNEDLKNQIFPLLNDKLDEIDPLTFSKLRDFFVSYESMIKYVTCERTKEILRNSR